MKTERSPQDCKTEKQICQLGRDNLDVGGLAILVQEKDVSLHFDGKYISIPKRLFDPIVSFYKKPQKITKRNH